MAQDRNKTRTGNPELHFWNLMNAHYLSGDDDKELTKLINKRKKETKTKTKPAKVEKNAIGVNKKIH